ncbi:DUF4184 family protein [Vitiosangium sp. GDMCC 1.1324]|uniref:DUF4184 family protein n=1 Tax=Vitiosangium sp. (strain GDMCC 1.1324) TaxID=2138576 RepID=UPI000D396844|nr:DUF4184 family protein [Vitiosangium sp. GDMCC 1.1324]PTL78645.1 hypothetical protein DAT35_36840 [Vitiosangium sp. GDMCC 1.1324]
MPVTLPAHAAAVLPLCRVRWLPPAALVVGSSVPDLAYLFGMSAFASHTPEGLLRFSLPVGLLLWVWLEVLVLPVLRRTLPEVGGVQWGRFLRTRGLPVGARAWAQAALAVWLGAATHALWDGFTHRYRWPAKELYPHASLALGPWELPLVTWLQHGSSVVGSLLVLGLLARRYPHLPETPGGSWRGFLPVLLPTVVLGALVLGLRLARAPLHAPLELQLQWTVWHVLDGALVGLTLGCVWARR